MGNTIADRTAPLLIHLQDRAIISFHEIVETGTYRITLKNCKSTLVCTCLVQMQFEWLIYKVIWHS